MLALTTLKQMADHVESNFQSTIYLTGPICILWRHPRGWGVGLRGAGLSVLSRGFAARPRARCFLGVLCFWVHTQRETWVPVPRPTGSLTARVLGNSGSAPPQVSVWGGSSFILLANRVALLERDYCIQYYSDVNSL